MNKAEILKFQKKCAAHGISPNVVCDRLRRGYSLYAALNIPANLRVKVDTLPTGETHYKVDRLFRAECPIFDMTESDLWDFIKESKKDTYK